MSDRFFLDTNIFVRSFDKSAPQKADRASKLIRQAIEVRAGMVSYQVVQEFFNLALRRFAQPMSGAEAEQYLSTTFRPLLAVHSSHGLYGQALRLASTCSLSWYDSLIVAAAIEGRCSILYS
jgi:predicted nucleic acid-binding protein